MKARALPLLVGLLGPLQLLPDWWLCILLLLLPEGTSGNATLKRDSCADTLCQALLTHARPATSASLASSSAVSTHLFSRALTSADPFLVYVGSGILGPVLISWGMGISFIVAYMNKNL